VTYFVNARASGRMVPSATRSSPANEGPEGAGLRVARAATDRQPENRVTRSTWTRTRNAGNNNIFGTISTMISESREGQLQLGADSRERRLPDWWNPSAAIAPGNPFGSPAFNTVRRRCRSCTAKHQALHGSVNVGYTADAAVQRGMTFGVDMTNQSAPTLRRSDTT